MYLVCNTEFCGQMILLDHILIIYTISLERAPSGNSGLVVIKKL